MIQPPMSSGQLARAAGVNVETLRFYERRGLLPEPERTTSGRRRYRVEALARLRLIKRAQALGFSLPDIAGLLDALSDPDAVCRDVCAAVQEKLDHVDRLIIELRARRRRLAKLREACPQTRPLRGCAVVEALVDEPIKGRRRSSP